MIVYIGYALGILILAGAGFLAWRNSKLIAEQKEKKGTLPAVSSYTVLVERQSAAGEAANAATLLEAAYRETEGTVKVRLSRVHGTVGELKLDHAVQIMEHTCSDLASKAEMIEVRASRDAVMNDEEGRALDRLEQGLRGSLANANR